MTNLFIIIKSMNAFILSMNAFIILQKTAMWVKTFLSFLPKEMTPT